MRWQGRRGSSNIEDRRGRIRVGGGGRRIGRAGGVGGLGVVAVVVIGYFFGIDVTPLLDQGGGAPTQTRSAPISEAERQAGQFASVTLADTEDVWARLFRDQLGATYQPVTMVLFSQVTQSPCGDASGATGPFYCPIDQKAYLDTAFFTTMERQLGAGGDFAAAYVIAHEVAHHVQDELGILQRANEAKANVGQTRANAISVRVELQADCLSGVWAKAAGQQFNSLEPGDIKEAMNAAKQIGDDTLQRSAGRVPAPHTFTHGTSEQRQSWFERGYRSGSVSQCDTFSAAEL